MKRKGTPGLRDMAQKYAISHCCSITADVWSKMDLSSQNDLLNVMRPYIMNGYKDTGEPVPAHIADAWDRCKQIIDKEAGL